MATMEEIKAVIADQLGVAPSDVTEDSRVVEDLGADSADVINLVASIEDKYGVEVQEDAIQNFKTVRDIYMGLGQ